MSRYAGAAAGKTAEGPETAAFPGSMRERKRRKGKAMKALILNERPRKDRNTAQLLKAARQKGRELARLAEGKDP